MRILGIETSCDETAAAVVEDGQHLLSNAVASSMDLHVAYGGVVPEIAARSHIEHMMPVVEKALHDAEIGWDSIDAIAVTQGPGLGGSLLVGVLTARTLAIIKKKPLYAVNHVLAHPYASFLTETGSIFNSQFSIHNDGQSPLALKNNYILPENQPEFPILALIVSGGHTQLVLFRDHFDYTLLGQTHDDAVGEAFDKVAKILGLPYPGGPSIAKKAQKGDPKAFSLPKSKMTGKYDFSFSGIKTAVLRAAQAEIGQDYNFPSHKLSDSLSEAQKANLAASFQHIAIETLVDKTVQAFKEFAPKSVVVAGGVAASSELRRQIAERLPISTIFPDPKLCTDNAAMIATLGYFMNKHGQLPADSYFLEIKPNLQM